MSTRLLWLILPLLLAAVAPAGAAQIYITTSCNAGGTVSPMKGKIPVNPGGALDVTFTAQDGYYLAGVKINNMAIADPLTDPKTFTYHFTGVQKNTTIAGTFARDPFVTVSTTAGGTITPAGKVSVPFGTGKSFSFQANTGYHLQDVVVDKASQGAVPSWQFDNVRENHSLKGVFTINTYPITIIVPPGGKILPAPLAAKHGQKITLTVTPDTGMMITGVTVNDAPVIGLPAAGAYKLAVTVTSDTTIAATFGELRPAAGLQQLKGTYNIVARNSTFGMSTWVGGTSVGEEISAQQITATFDGAGKCSISSIKGASFNKGTDGSGNDTVNVSPKTGRPTSCSYTIDKGAFTLTLGAPDGTETVKGWVSADGNTLITGGPEQNAEGTEYRIETITGVKAGSGMTKGSLKGTYHLVNQEASFSKYTGGGWTSVSTNLHGNNITADFDGSGGCTIGLTGADYDIQTDPSGNQSVTVWPSTDTITGCSYTVTAAGVFSLNITGGDGSETVNGWASADGNAVVLGGSSQQVQGNGTEYRTEHIFGVRSGAATNNSTLSGNYQILGSSPGFWQSTGVGQSSVSKTINANKVEASFDGSGGCSVSFTSADYSKGTDNVGNGIVNVGGNSGTSTACAYSVAADGSFTLDITFLQDIVSVSGWLGADGNTVVMGGPRQQADPGGTNYQVELMVGTRIQSALP